jgi:hypothetical protein
MAKVNETRKQQWKENYQKLIAAGFSSKEAGRINKSNKNTETALKTGQLPPKSEKQQKAGIIGSQKRREKKQPVQVTPKEKKKPEKIKAAGKGGIGARRGYFF